MRQEEWRKRPACDRDTDRLGWCGRGTTQRDARCHDGNRDAYPADSPFKNSSPRSRRRESAPILWAFWKNCAPTNVGGYFLNGLLPHEPLNLGAKGSLHPHPLLIIRLRRVVFGVAPKTSLHQLLRTEPPGHRGDRRLSI